METIINILFGRVAKPYRQRYREEQTKTNLCRMSGLSVYMLLIQILLNAVNILTPAGTEDSNIMLFAALSIAAMGVGLIFFVLSVLCWRGKIRNERVLRHLPYLLIYLYGIFQMAFFTLNLQAETGVMNTYVIAVILISFGLVVMPILNFINVGSCMAYAFTVMYLTRGDNHIWDSVMITDAWANLIVITILILFMSTLSYSMYRSNFITRIKLERSVRHAEELARIDTLTGAMNRRGFFELLEEYWPELTAENRNVAMAMFDIDFFKDFNDRFGHLTGDNCLFEVSTALRVYFHEHNGWFCRFGGEEFLAVYFPEPDEDVRQVIEHARQAVEQAAITGAPEEDQRVTVSAGFDVGRASDIHYERLINRADIALYHSKRNGRNIVSGYNETKGAKSVHARNGRDQEDGYTGSEKRSGNNRPEQ